MELIFLILAPALLCVAGGWIYIYGVCAASYILKISWWIPLSISIGVAAIVQFITESEHIGLIWLASILITIGLVNMIRRIY